MITLKKFDFIVNILVKFDKTGQDSDNYLQIFLCIF